MTRDPSMSSAPDTHVFTGGMLAQILALMTAVDREKLDPAVRMKLNILDEDVMRHSPHAIWRLQVDK